MFFPTCFLAAALSASTTLELVTESKVIDCLPTTSDTTDFEASGVIARGANLVIDFDNIQAVAVVDSDLSQCKNGTGSLRELPALPDTEGYEAITRMQDDTYIVVQETYKVDGNKATYHARARRYSDLLIGTTSPRLLADADLAYEFESDNKGIEGAAMVYHSSGKHFLLALCEGNKCQSGKDGKTPGHGNVLVFWLENNGTSFTYNDKINLPSRLPFVDFSGLDSRLIPGHTDEFQLAVVSQTTSSLWLGNVVARPDTTKPSGLDFAVIGDGEGGTDYTFPLTSGGDLQYCNVEGVSFLTPFSSTKTRLAFASDKAKSDQPDSCLTKGQSIHIFDVPM